MRRLIAVLLVVVVMTMGQSSEVFLSDSRQVKSTESQLSLAFANGPIQDENVKGLYTLSFSSTGTGTIESIEIEISNDSKICIIAGPCQLETEQHAMDMAGKIQEITKKFGLGFIYKTSFDKANRTSLKGKEEQV